MTSLADCLSVRGLSARYGAERVLDRVDLPDIQPATITALAGPNGAGKSTLLRAVAGLVRASGSVRWRGRDLLPLDSAERGKILGFMPQSIAATNGLTVLESVIASFRAFAPNQAGAIAQDHALATLERIGLIDLAMKRLGRLSGGQRQLASLAQSLVRDPDILLLDEPTSALDLRHQIEVMTLLRRIAASGRVVLVVLHDLTLAANWADQVVFLHEGRVISAGSPADVLTPQLLCDVYGLRSAIAHTEAGTRHLVVQGLDRPKADDKERIASP